MPISSFQLKTDSNAAYDITQQVADAVKNSGANSGIGVVALPHTTAAVCIISFPDPNTLEDVMDEVARLVPTRIDFKHQHDTPRTRPGTSNPRLSGAAFRYSSIAVLPSSDIHRKTDSSEFDGPRERSVGVCVVPS